jgi:hypothetical protein
LNHIDGAWLRLGRESGAGDCDRCDDGYGGEPTESKCRDIDECVEYKKYHRAAG